MDLASETTQQEPHDGAEYSKQEERCAALVKEQEKGRASQEEPRAADTMRANQQKSRVKHRIGRNRQNCHGMAAAARRERTVGSRFARFKGKLCTSAN
jgi:hypothetical protein